MIAILLEKNIKIRNLSLWYRKKLLTNTHATFEKLPLLILIRFVLKNCWTSSQIASVMHVCTKKQNIVFHCILSYIIRLCLIILVSWLKVNQALGKFFFKTNCIYMELSLGKFIPVTWRVLWLIIFLSWKTIISDS